MRTLPEVKNDDPTRQLSRLQPPPPEAPPLRRSAAFGAQDALPLLRRSEGGRVRGQALRARSDPASRRRDLVRGAPGDPEEGPWRGGVRGRDARRRAVPGAARPAGARDGPRGGRALPRSPSTVPRGARRFPSRAAGRRRDLAEAALRGRGAGAGGRRNRQLGGACPVRLGNRDGDRLGSGRSGAQQPEQAGPVPARGHRLAEGRGPGPAVCRIRSGHEDPRGATAGGDRRGSRRPPGAGRNGGELRGRALGERGLGPRRRCLRAAGDPAHRRRRLRGPSRHPRDHRPAGSERVLCASSTSSPWTGGRMLSRAVPTAPVVPPSPR
jgi:hypothetical protein